MQNFHSGRTHTLLLAWACLIFSCFGTCASPAFAAPGATPAQTDADFQLEDFLGRAWRNELVSFPLTPAQADRAKANHALVDAQGAQLTYQVFAKDNAQRIAFLTDLSPFARKSFRFTPDAAKSETDLTFQETAENLILSNARIAISLRKKSGTGKGPIASVRLNSGRWVGESDWSVDLAEYSTQVIARGPVFHEVICRGTFARGGQWSMRVRLNAREPVILIDESYNMPDRTVQWALNLDHHLMPDTVLYRDGHDRNVPAVWTINHEDIWYLQPWTQWWARSRGGPCFSVFRAAPAVASTPAQPTDGKPTPELLTIASRDASVWVDPTIPEAERGEPFIDVKRYGGVLWAPLHLYGRGARNWMIAALPAKEGVAMLRVQKGAQPPSQISAAAPKGDTIALDEDEKLPEKFVLLADQYMIKHSHFPLDRVKDFTLQWDSEKDVYPCLFVRKTDLPAIRKNESDQALFAPRIADFQTSKLSQYALDGDVTATAAFHLTGDAQIAQNVAENCLSHLQNAVNVFLNQDVMSFGTSPHITREFVVPALGMADVALAAENWSPDKRRRILAQLALLGYVYSSPDYWSPERGFKANPNMTTTVNWLNLMIACLVPSHPQAKQWAAKALHELHSELRDWPDENGGWLESPHYSTVSYDQLLASLLMARNAGFDDALFDPRMKKAAAWFAKISTPPDSRAGGRRNLPPVGNTYLLEPTGLFGTVATIWQEKDPLFASQMRWMFEQQGSVRDGMGLIGVKGLFRGAGITPRAPEYGSELFPRTGAVLRHGFPSDRETYLYLVAGKNHDHYDDDSGSFVFWGLGRVLGDDFGYYGLAPQDDQSMLSTAGAHGVMEVKAFATSKGLDYVQGVKGPWMRQIALIKPQDKEPAYFLLADTLDAPAPFTWRLWLTANDVVLGKDLANAPVANSKEETVAASRALMVGQEDVDMDVFMLTPSAPPMRTEKKTIRSNMGFDAKGKQVMPMMVTQIGLLSQGSGTGLTALLIPRMKSAAAPIVTPLADGRGAKVQRGDEIDYVFLSAKPFGFSEGPLKFSGTTGSVQIRAGKANLSLGASGTISYGLESLTKP